MGVWITCRSPAPSEIVLCKTKQMCPGLAPSEGTAPAAARSPAPGLNPRQHLQERGRAVLQLTRALRELRAQGAARVCRAPRCHQAGAAAPALHQLCAASGEATSKQSWPRLAPGAGAGVGMLGAAPRLLPLGQFFPGHWEAPQVLSLSPESRGQPRVAALPAPLQGHVALQQEVSPRVPPPRSAHATAAAQQPAPKCRAGHAKHP